MEKVTLGPHLKRLPRETFSTVTPTSNFSLLSQNSLTQFHHSIPDPLRLV